MNKKLLVYLVVVTGLLTYMLYRYQRSQPPGQERIDYCNALVKDMPENTRDEINRSINTFRECLGG